MGSESSGAGGKEYGDSGTETGVDQVSGGTCMGSGEVKGLCMSGWYGGAVA